MKSSDQASESFLQLIEAHKGIILKVCHGYCHQAATRDDLAQEIIYQAWKSHPRYKPAYRYSTWLYRIALNVAVAHYREMRRMHQWIALGENHLHIQEPATQEEQKEGQQFLQSFMEGLKPLDRALLILHLDERSYQEIGEILGISASNVGTKLNRLRQKMKIEAEKRNII